MTIKRVVKAEVEEADDSKSLLALNGFTQPVLILGARDVEMLRFELSPAKQQRRMQRKRRRTDDGRPSEKQKRVGGKEEKAVDCISTSPNALPSIDEHAAVEEKPRRLSKNALANEEEGKKKVSAPIWSKNVATTILDELLAEEEQPAVLVVEPIPSPLQLQQPSKQGKPQRPCRVSVSCQLGTKPSGIIFADFDRTSRRVYARWGWPENQQPFDFALVTIERYTTEGGRWLPKEERRFSARNQPRPLVKERMVLTPQQTHASKVPTMLSLPGGYAAHEVRIEVVPGEYETIRVELYRSNICAVQKALGPTRHVLTLKELQALYKLAKRYIAEQCGLAVKHTFNTLHRCKPKLYFEIARTRHRNRLLPYLKDQNGHVASAINGRLEGTFYLAATSTNLDCSPFGDMHFKIRASKLLNMREHRIYFADFYCNSKLPQLVEVNGGSGEDAPTSSAPTSSFPFTPPHYITLVVCKRGSASDDFCQRHLLELDLKSSSSILQMQKHPLEGTTYTISGCNPQVWVEVFYTETVDMCEGEELKSIETRGAGHSTQEGLKRDPNCTHCDAY